ncbi:MAG: hypothetical protein K2X48_09245 [Chitinophagaceae bacterium]|nr:hypothetical protein [Chitinophagaceae bacterium]
MKKIIFIAAVLSVAFFSCKREKSIDSTTGTTGTPVFLGTNCRISQVLNVDSLSSIGLEAHNIFFNSTGVATRVQLIDSITNDVYLNDSYTYKGDTIFIAGVGYLLKNNTTGRISLFRGLEDPTDPLSDTIIINFTYNTSGFLTKAEYAYTFLPVTVLRSTYTYTGNNLTKARTDVLAPSFETVITSDLEYTSQPVRDFIYTIPDAYYTYPYLPAFNFGNKSANALKKVTTRYFDNGVATDSAITTYKNFRLSADGYVLEFYADGDLQDGMGIYDGRTKFKYFCR